MSLPILKCPKCSSEKLNWKGKGSKASDQLYIDWLIKGNYYVFKYGNAKLIGDSYRPNKYEGKTTLSLSEVEEIFCKCGFHSHQVVEFIPMLN